MPIKCHSLVSQGARAAQLNRIVRPESSGAHGLFVPGKPDGKLKP
jgi:hypothetical protein